MSEDITLGEVGRSLKRLEVSQQLQTNTLDKIKEQTTRTNGRVDALERRVETDIGRELRELKQTRRAAASDATLAPDRPDVITINIPAGVISPKTIATIVAAVVTAALAAWKAGVL